MTGSGFLETPEISETPESVILETPESVAAVSVESVGGELPKGGVSADAAAGSGSDGARAFC